MNGVAASHAPPMFHPNSSGLYSQNQDVSFQMQNLQIRPSVVPLPAFTQHASDSKFIMPSSHPKPEFHYGKPSDSSRNLDTSSQLAAMIQSSINAKKVQLGPAALDMLRAGPPSSSSMAHSGL
jgi:hypothetical protein